VSARPVLDTHAWVWWVDRDKRIGRAALSALDEMPSDGRPYLCDISLWEVATLVERKRLSLAVPLDDWLASAAHPRSVTLVPISTAIASGVANLPAGFHRDPADRLIVSTCRVLDAPLLTKDRLILSSRLVKRWKPASNQP
jgi:PIN domain nuclease of toxin-antitoxin system